MSKLVVLNIDEGSFEQGFPVRLGIGEDGRIYHKDKVILTPAPKIPELYQDWKHKYCDLGETIRQIEVAQTQVTNFSAIEDENLARKRFEDYLHQWFAQLPWRELRVRIEEKTHPNDLIRVIIDTQNIYLKKLPWHLWELFHNRPHAEFALSAEYAPPSDNLKFPIKILAIFGSSEGLNLASDKELIANLSHRGAKITWLEKPQKKDLSHSLWEQHWDIIFFAGHSSSKAEYKTGEIQINDSESISLNRFRNALKTAVKNGLKLAIFNSCDGLGIADELIGVKVPQMIVMREPVPDEVARHFLKYFLEYFSQGHSLYLAVRNARERLEFLEDNFPCASWLPVICQNPAARPLIWAKSSMTIMKISILGGIAIAFIFIGNLILNNFFVSNNSSKTQPLLQDESNIISSLKNLGDSFSWGEKILIPANSNKFKIQGIKAFSENNYIKSILKFNQSLQQNQNDPETLIYLNNAVSMKPSEIDQLPVTTSSYGKSCKIDEQKPLKIAVIAPSIANLENEINEEILRGVAQAQNKINLQCGIEGRMLQIIIVDDNNKPNNSFKIAKQLVDYKNILAVVGHYSSGATKTAGEVYDNKMVVISPTSTAVRTSNDKGYGINLNQYIFRTPTNDEIATKNLLNYMVDRLGKKKAAIAYNSSKPYSENFRKELENQLKSRNAELIVFPECDLDNNSSLEKCVQKAKKEVSVLAIVPATSQSLNKALNMLDNYNDFNLTLLAGDSLYRETVIEKGENAKNLVVVVPWFHNRDNPSQFEKEALKLWATQVTWRTAMSYDATMTIVEGLRRIINNGKNPTAQELQKVLSAEDFSVKGAAGEFKFENGDRRIWENNPNHAQIGVLVQVKCDNKNDCQFVKLPQ